MLAFVPVVFDAYRQLAPRLWPVMQALVAHADRAGRCWPSVRRIAEIINCPKSSVARYIRALERAGYLSRSWRRGGRCTYTIAARFLPGEVSQRRRASVPVARTEELPTKKTSGLHVDEAFKWRARVRQWREFGRWVASWGPKPGQPGCFIPSTILDSIDTAMSRDQR